jgi:uncharacterized protein
MANTKKGWLDRMLRRVEEGEPAEKVIESFRDALPDGALEEGHSGMGSDPDNHIHIHLNGKGKADDQEDPADMNGVGEGTATAPTLEGLAQEVAQLKQMVQELMAQEEQEVELEGDNEDGTKDARRYVMRRGSKLKTHDEEAPVPERTPEMMGETDLPGIEDLNKRTTDSVSMESLWQQTIAAAEILMPGIRVPTFDAKHHPTLTAKRLCAFRRNVIEQAFPNVAAAPVIKSFVGDNKAMLKKLPCDTVKACFNLASNAVRNYNNGTAVMGTTGTKDGGTMQNSNRPLTPAEINKINRDYYKSGSGNGSIR